MTMFKIPMMWCDDGGVVPGRRATAAEQVPHSKLALYNIRPEQVVPASSSQSETFDRALSSILRFYFGNDNLRKFQTENPD